ncbi:DUF1054 family protein [Latilactobacillus sakei]
MFTRADFEIFDDPTLKGRLNKIYTELDPKFEVFGAQLQNELAVATNREFTAAYCQTFTPLQKSTNEYLDGA